MIRLIILLHLVSSLSFASRVFLSPTITSSSVTYHPGYSKGPSVGSCGMRVYLTNIGNSPQTVSVDILDQSLYFQITVKNRPGFVGWDLSHSIWAASKTDGPRDISIDVNNPVIQANESKMFGVARYCVAKRNITDACGQLNIGDKLPSDTDIRGDPWVESSISGVYKSTPDCNIVDAKCGGMVTNEFRVKVTVQEDIGAISAVVEASCFLGHSNREVLQNNKTLYLNSGRPF